MSRSTLVEAVAFGHPARGAAVAAAASTVTIRPKDPITRGGRATIAWLGWAWTALHDIRTRNNHLRWELLPLSGLNDAIVEVDRVATARVGGCW